MSIEIKISKKPVEYVKAVSFLEKRMLELKDKKQSELIWILEHPSTYTKGIRSKENEILDKNLKIINTNRGGKLTWHGSGQIVCYFVLNLNTRGKDVRRFILILEKAIIKTIEEYGIKSYADRKNIGIWVNDKNKIKKVAAIGLKIKRWIVYHGFSINISNKLDAYKKIIPCGIKQNSVTSLKKIKNQSYKGIEKKIINNLIKFLDD
jgi:lipoate-protein ligase B